MNPARLAQLLDEFEKKRLLVIGDLILDEFIWGKVSRISPEAPVPVVEVEGQSYYPGGAANVSRNLCEFTRNVQVMGLVGEDSHAEHLQTLLKKYGISLECLQRQSGFQTIVKTRIIAKHQQVVRVDREGHFSLSPQAATNLLEKFERVLPHIDAVIFEDYGKGLLQQQLIDRMIEMLVRRDVIVTVDPNPRSTLKWHSATAVTPNRSEAFAAAGHVFTDAINPPGKDEALLEIGSALLERWQCQIVLITLGEHGMMLFQRGEEPFYIPTRAREVFDVSGAGDTAIALFTLALSAGATPVEAAEISNHASGVVVGKLGTATVTREELVASFDKSPKTA
jgi:D-glycero-beta-D-manno-heptose-7-phosphate kinase